MMPHKIFQPEDFTSKAAELRARFSILAPDTIFNVGTGEGNVPADALPVFVD